MVVLYYILWTLGLAFKLSVIRWAQIIFYGPRGDSWSETGQIILTGFRFDLMVVGFWLSPFVIYLILSEIFSARFFMKPVAAKIYLLTSWLFICFLYFKDLVSFPFQQGRMDWQDHLQHPVLNWSHAGQLQWWSWIVIIFLIVGLFQAVAKGISKRLYDYQKVGFFSLAFIFLWSVLICRGTLSAHHLRRHDCQFSANKRVEAICLNPVFTFSK